MMQLAAALLALAIQQDTTRPPRPDTAQAARPDTARVERPDTLEPQEPDTSSLAPSAAHLASAYRDETARSLVARARERRRTVDRSVDRYRAIAREHIWAGLRVPGRDRTLYRRETATRIDWRREGPIRLEVLGAREVIPPVRGSPQIPDDLRNFVPHLAFDPVDSEVLLRLNDDFLRNPLAPNGERHYRYATGDTTEIRLPDGRTVRLVELRILPRRADFHLIRGSFWLEQQTNAVVQAVFRPARAFDLGRDGDDDDDVPGIFKPIRFQLDYVTLEYAFWDFEWWLPRTLAAEGVLQITSLLKMPFSYGLSYADYDVEGDTARARLEMPLDSIGRTPCTPAGRMTVKVDIGDDEPHERADSVERPDSAGDAAVAPDTSHTRGMHVDEQTGRGTDRCGRELQVDLPADSASLLAGEHLPPSIFESDTDWEREKERVRELAELLGDFAEAPWQRPAPTFSWGPGASGLLRYNRVEGLSVGARGDLDLGRLRFDATARLAVAEPRPDIELGVTRPAFNRDYRLSAYNRVTPVDPATRAFGIGNSFNALFLGRDDGEYYEALGASLAVQPAITRQQWYAVRLFAERHDDVETATDFSVPGLFDGDRVFRPNIVADEATLYGGELMLSGGVGEDPAGLRVVATLALDGAGGDFSFGRAALTTRVAFPLFAKLSGSLEGAAGTSTGDVPAQRLYYLGGPASLRGYAGNAARGDAFWRARGEIARGIPAVRIALFGDLGWAGERTAFTTDGALSAIGLGATFLDGLVRADLAHALNGDKGWRLDLWVETR